MKHLILKILDLHVFLVLGLLLLLSEVYPLTWFDPLLDGGDSLGDQFLHTSQLDIKGEGVFLGNVDDLVDDELLVRDKFGRMQGLADNLQHVDVGERREGVRALDIEDPGEEALEVDLLRDDQGDELGDAQGLQGVRQEVQDRIQRVRIDRGLGGR